MKNKLGNVLNYIVPLAKSEGFKETFRMTEKDFTRNRKLSFFDYISIIMQCSKSSLQSTLNMYLQAKREKSLEYSKQAFSKGRHRIKAEAFKYLMEETAKKFYDDGDFKTFRDYVLLSIDGSDYNLPYSPELLNVFGSESFSNGVQVQALTSTLFDVLNGIVLEAEIKPFNANERELAITHLKRFRNKSDKEAIVMMDRGYPSFDLIYNCEILNLKYLMRCNKDTFLKEIRKADKSDETVVITRNGTEVTVRVVTVQVNDTPFTFITNLTDEIYTKEDFAQLYYRRWNIEILYNKLKNTLEIENFSGLDELCVKQDFYASMILLNLSACSIFESQKVINKQRNSEKIYKANHTFAVSELKMRLIKMLYTDSSLVRLKESNYIKKALTKNTILFRPDRTCERKCFHPCLKNSPNHKRTSL